MIVFKFGGKSLGDKKKMSKIAKYIKLRSKQEKLIVVVSAMADTTDRLIALANEYDKKPCSRELDAFISCGENISASLLSIRLCSLGVKACSLLGWQAKIYADGDFGNGKITAIDKSIIEKKLKEYDCVIVAGFQAQNSNGDIITLGRGGSDTTAVALGKAFDCPVEIYSDFDGIFAGDPRRGNFKKYNSLDYNTALNYSKMGAKVLSASSAKLAKEAKVKLVCKSSENPKLSGTKIADSPTRFVGVVVKENLSEMNLVFNKNFEKMLKTLQFFIKNVKFKQILIKEQTISIILEQKDLAFTEKEISKINEIYSKQKEIYDI